MSGPYQSNILRLLVGQYRLGLDRHRRAVMNTRSTVALGAEVGAAFAMTPVYVAVRMSQVARQKLRWTVAQRYLPSAFSKAMNRLSSLGSRRLLGRRGLTAWSRYLPNDLPDNGTEHEDTASLAKQAVSRSVPKVFSKFVLKAISVLRTLMGKAVSVIYEENFYQRNCEVAVTTFSQSLSSQSFDVLSSEPSSNQTKSSLVWSMRSFWVALLEAVANLKPRWNNKRLESASVALPNAASSRELPNGCQSRQLSLDFVNAASQSSDVLSSESSSNETKSSLVWSTRSFWVALLEAVANLKPRWNDKRLESASVAFPNTTVSELPSGYQLRQLSLDFVEDALPSAEGQVEDDPQTMPVLAVDLSVAANRFLDAKVIAFEYVEHPLETALKWIDRILTWVESRWKTLVKAYLDWISKM